MKEEIQSEIKLSEKKKNNKPSFRNKTPGRSNRPSLATDIKLM